MRVSTIENLIKRRITEMKIAQETYNFKNVWSQDGKLFYTHANIGTTSRYFMIKLW